MREPVAIAGLALGVALTAFVGKAHIIRGASSAIPEGSIASFRPASNAYLMAGTADSAASDPKSRLRS
jgi:ABC-type arginine/histidine transport system permease subunit